MRSDSIKAILIAVLTGLGCLISAVPAQAIPSFARQTGMSCSACHTVYPELTTYGRTFKLNGYTTNNTDELKDGSDEAGYRLQISNVPPLSAMLQIADVFVKKPASTASGTADMASDKNGSLEFPSQFSLFYAGKISPKMGAFVQVTYDSGSGAFAMDNTDVRYADRIQIANTDLVYGLTANNNPTVQDIFNTVPAWSFPYFTGKSAMTPLANTQLESLAGNVGGLGAYVFWNQLLYAEASAYRSAPQGFGNNPAPTYGAIQGFSPYWRVALTKDFDKHSMEIGAFGLDEHSVPSGNPILGPQDHFNDVGLDAQYQYVSQEHCITLKGSEIWENQTWDYSNGTMAGVVANPTDTLRSFKVDATYYYDRKIGLTLGYFSTTGSPDAVIYGGNLANTPDTEGFIAELNFVPWYNTKFGLQYTYFDKFNGSTDGYAATGDHATDNNTLVASAWLMY
jgi:hypothetical protein